ncbi:MAG: hypothetical protein SGPRY_011979 [Prymnesium sp.]
MSSSERLLEENRLLGAIIEELRAQLRQTEDALLQTHAEAERWREEKEQRAREAREWQKEWQREKEKEAERGADERERFGESRISFTTRPGRGEAVVERVLLGELSSLEGEGGSLRSQADRWRVAAVEAGEAMREAQAECGLLHSQLQRLIAEDAPSSPACRAALKQQLRAELAGRRSEAGFGGAAGEAYLGAVGRCHDLQRYVTQLASLDSKVRPQLIKAEERVASLLRENAGLHARLSGGAAAAHAALENAMVPNGGAEAFGASEEERAGSCKSYALGEEVALLRRHVPWSEQAMARAEQLEEAIEARLSAERARTAAETALQTEMSWARSLDEMRVLDLGAIQQLEGKLAQWAMWHDRHQQIGATSHDALRAAQLK